MSVIDDFMSKVIDLDEKEKEEVILFLANALLYPKFTDHLKNISVKVHLVMLPFLTDVAMKIMKEEKGGEKVGTGTGLKNNQGCRT